MCRMHGGTAGANRGNWKHGRYSKALGKLGWNYESSRDDKSLFDLREPVAALDGVVQRLMELAAAHEGTDGELDRLETLSASLDRLARRIEGAWAVHLRRSEVMNKEEVRQAMSRFLLIVRQEGGAQVAARVTERCIRELKEAAPAEPDAGS